MMPQDRMIPDKGKSEQQDKVRYENSLPSILEANGRTDKLRKDLKKITNNGEFDPGSG